MNILCLDNGGQEPNSVVNQRTIEATYLALASEGIEFQTRRRQPTRRETGTAEGLIGASVAGDWRRLSLNLAGAKLRHAKSASWGPHLWRHISGFSGRDFHGAFFPIGLSLVFQVCATTFTSTNRTTTASSGTNFLFIVDAISLSLWQSTHRN